MAARFAILAGLLASSGCCLDVISGVQGDTGTTARGAGPTGASSAGASTAGAGNGTAGTVSTTGGIAGSTGGSASGTTTGSPVLPGCMPAAATDLTQKIAYAISDGSPDGGSTSFYQLASADLNGDGMLDLVAGSSFVDTFAVFFGLPNGGLSAPTIYPYAASALAIGDIDGDGHPDVVAAAGYVIDVFLNDGTGALELAGSFPTSGQLTDLAVGDLNGDGKGDVLASENDFPSIPDEIFLSLQNGELAAPVRLPGASGTLFGGAVIGDVNGDGLNDIVTDSADQTELLVLLNQGDGGFLSNPYLAPAAPAVILVSQLDRAPNLVVSNSGADDWGYGNGGLQLLRNLGTGTFEVGQISSAPGAFLATGDFNGDCIPDLVESRWEQCGTGVVLNVFFGLSDGGFEEPVALAAPQGPAQVAVLGEVSHPRAIAVADTCGGGIVVYGDARRQ